MFQFIQQQTELVDVLQQMDQCSTYGLDTEFIKVDTLWPKLGVCQVNVNGNVYLRPLHETAPLLEAYHQTEKKQRMAMK